MLPSNFAVSWGLVLWPVKCKEEELKSPCLPFHSSVFQCADTGIYVIVALSDWGPPSSPSWVRSLLLC